MNDEKSVNDQVVAALARRGDLFDHFCKLAMVTDELCDDGRCRKTIQSLSLARLREIVSETCEFFAVGEANAGAHDELKRVQKWTYDAIFARGYWPGISAIRGIVTGPVMRSDGTILQTPGYDPVTGLYFDQTEVFPPINENPSIDDVKQAVETLFDLVADFPFVDALSRSAWLASLLTPLAREAYSGCTGPLFLFDANVRGSGKGVQRQIKCAA